VLLAGILATTGLVSGQPARATSRSVSWADPTPDAFDIQGAASGGPDAKTVDLVRTTVADAGKNIAFSWQMMKLGYSVTSAGWFARTIFTAEGTNYVVYHERDPYGDSCAVGTIELIEVFGVGSTQTFPDNSVHCKDTANTKTNTITVTVPKADLVALAEAHGAKTPITMRKLDAQSGSRDVPTVYGKGWIEDDDPAPGHLSFTV